MAAKLILVLCAQALLIQTTFSQCHGRRGIAAPYGLVDRDWDYDGLAYNGFAAPSGLARRGWDYNGRGCGGLDYTVTSGGSLPVTSGSAIPPAGVSLASKNIYEGILAAAGEVPFVGTVGVEGVVPAAGASAVNYSCGNGVTAMAADVAPGIGLGKYCLGIGEYGLGGFGAGLGYRGFAGRGCGCGIL